MTQQIVVSFDIGGTNMRAATLAVGSGGAELLEQTRRPTPNHLLSPHTPARTRLEDALGFIVDYARSAQARFGANAMAAAFPGPVEGRGTVVALPTFWGADGQSLCPIALDLLLAERLPGMAVRVMNDVTAAGYRFSRDHSDFALFTLGSGVGLKVFAAGQPQLGPHRRGGELAHMVFDPSPEAPACDCGGRGHLGALASGRAWQRVVADAERRGVAPDLAAFAEPLARAVAMLHFSLGLECFLFAGGLADGLGEALRAAIVQRLPEQGWNVGQDWNSMIRLTPADDAHALIGGALALAAGSKGPFAE